MRLKIVSIKKRIEMKNFSTDFFLTFIFIFQYLPTHKISSRSREPTQKLSNVGAIEHSTKISLKKRSELIENIHPKKGEKKLYLPIY